MRRSAGKEIDTRLPCREIATLQRGVGLGVPLPVSRGSLRQVGVDAGAQLLYLGVCR
ncbi:MAG: hypothetical protein QOI83_1948, partial [Streptomycetaceae bacterium]|nr:hypothetical protein [Streptomycetaceae bacterium]